MVLYGLCQYEMKNDRKSAGVHMTLFMYLRVNLSPHPINKILGSLITYAYLHSLLKNTLGNSPSRERSSLFIQD